MKKTYKAIQNFVVRTIIGFFLVSIGLVVLYRFVPVPFTLLMVQRSVEQMLDGKELKLSKNWMNAEKISPNMRKAVVAAEDQLFYEHNGFDTKAIEKALKYNEKQKTKKRKRMRGASTISQQTAKNVFLWSSRSWVRKGFEVYFTFFIELIWSKERILEVYLNVIETGDGIYGVEAAAQAFFNTSAAKLSASQAATIAAVLPNPRKWNAGEPSAYVSKRKNWILRQMHNF
jgi:monofunctional biosynthetic peptidoglycan transglycosylase